MITKNCGKNKTEKKNKLTIIHSGISFDVLQYVYVCIYLVYFRCCVLCLPLFSRRLSTFPSCHYRPVGVISKIDRQ